jgi:AraC-like DNA-binding protein
MPEHYQKILQYFEYLSATYHVSICIKDFSGFIPLDKDLDHSLQPYLAHTNPFCMYIKADQKQYFRCLDMMRPMYIRCAQGKPFFGLCHAGVGEYVIPIKIQNIVLGAITAGFFPEKPELSDFLIKQKSRASPKIDYKTARGLFEQFIVPATIKIEEMIVLLEMAAEYLSNMYLHIKNIHSGENLPTRRYRSREDTIIAHALEYIQKNYASPIMVKDVAANCYCSESYINHSFKQRVNMNVNTYINKVRIEHAKRRLLDSNDKMANIALDTGFNDPNYFSRVFTNLMGCSPSEFRRRFT